MSKDEIFVKVTIRIHPGDKERAERFFPHAGYNKAFREIIHKQLDAIEEAFNRRAQTPKVGEI